MKGIPVRRNDVSMSNMTSTLRKQQAFLSGSHKAAQLTEPQQSFRSGTLVLSARVWLACELGFEIPKWLSVEWLSRSWLPFYKVSEKVGTRNRNATRKGHNLDRLALGICQNQGPSKCSLACRSPNCDDWCLRLFLSVFQTWHWRKRLDSRVVCVVPMLETAPSLRGT